MVPGMIGETPYDLTWRMFGIHVRVHPLFWVGGAIISWPLLDLGIPYFLIGIACVFVSILLHELGHVVVGNYYGSRGHIVLWAFGGLAIGSNNLRSRWQRVAVSFAGPLIQLILYGLLRLAVEHLFPSLGILFLTDRWLAVILIELLWINLYWPLLNLLPIWPLDGGQITREVFGAFTPRNAVRLSLHLSIAVAGLLALYGFLTEHHPSRVPLIPYVPTGYRSAIFFVLFVGMGIQALQFEHAQRRDFDPWDHERW